MSWPRGSKHRPVRIQSNRARKSCRRADIDKYFQARGAPADRRIRAFRLAWDFVGSALAGRGELYERFYLQDSFRMTALAYKLAEKEHPLALVERFLRDD